MSESLEQEARRELESQICLCGARKRKGESFCRPCYYALPAGLRHRLYTPFSEGYASYWDQACDFLRYETDRIQPKAPRQEGLPING